VGIEITPAVVNDEPTKSKWIQLKIETLDNYINGLIQAIKVYRPTAKIARNIYSEAVTNPASQAWFAHNLESFLRNYDYTLIMAYSQMEIIGGLGKTKKWQEQLVSKIKSCQGNNKAIFKG